MTNGDIKFNARELIDALRNSSVRLYENALDAIADSFGRIGTWIDDDEGNMILLEDDEDFDAETHNHTPHDYYTPTGPSDSPDVSGYLSQDSQGSINTFMSETESEEEWPEHECVTCMEGMDELVAKGQSWSCECCGFMVGTEDDHEYCGKNIDGTIVCNHCYDGGHKVTTMITLDGNEVIFNSTCQGEGNEKRFGDGEYEITEEYVFGSEEGNAPIQDPMEFGEMANWTPLDGSEGLKRKRAESSELSMTLANMERELGIDSEDYEDYEKYTNPTARLNAAISKIEREFGVNEEDYQYRGLKKDAESFSAEYSGPSTLSSALSGARKTGRSGKHLTIVQRLVAKYGIDKGVKIYKHFGVKQKRASPKVRGKVRGTKSGPRRYSEGRVGGAGRSQVYQKGDRTGSWTPSGGHTTRFANSGKAWYQERGLGTPVAGPIPDTDLAGKSMGEKVRGSFVNPHGIVGYPFVPAQQRERKSKK